MTLFLRFHEEDWLRTRHDWNLWWAGELERPLLVLELVDPISALDWSHLTRWGLHTPVDQLIDNAARMLEAAHWLGDAYPKWWVNYGPGIMAGFLGAQVNYSTETTWFSKLEHAASLNEIHPAYDPLNPWWQRVLQVTRAALERWGDQVVIGTTDLGGNLDILASLRGSERLLFDLTDNPAEVDRLARQITTLWLRYYDELFTITSKTGLGNACWAPPWSPGKGYMLQCDFSYMISPRMFSRFVMPDLQSCCAYLDYAFYHLDGKGEIPHLDQLLSLERLRGIQWVPGDGQPPPEHWLELLQRVRRAGKLVQLSVDAEGALQIKRELGGKGFLFYIVNEDFTPETGEAFVRAFHAA